MASYSMADVQGGSYDGYPAEIRDLDSWMEKNWEWFDPASAASTLWPDGLSDRDLDILVAGSGPNQAAVIARCNPESRVVAIDVSRRAIDHLQSLKDAYGLTNLDLRVVAVEEVESLGREFDLIVATNVVEHLADPVAGLGALAHCLRRTGVLGIAVDAKYGRFGVEMLQSTFELLGLASDAASVQVVRELISALPPEHPVLNYFKMAPVSAQSGAGLAHTFLHGPSRVFSVNDALKLVRAAGLVFQGWFLKAPYYPHDWFVPGGPIGDVIGSLSGSDLWSVMERLNVMNACHMFMACRSDRPVESYEIDFSIAPALDYIPEFRARCGFERDELYRPNWRTRVTPVQLAFLEHVNGHRSIRKIAKRVLKQSGSMEGDLADLEQFGCSLFASLWRLDFMAMTFNGSERKETMAGDGRSWK